MSDLEFTPALRRSLRHPPASWRGSRNPRYDAHHAAEQPHAPVIPLAVMALAAIAGLAAWLLSNASPV
jgi:hypothetical protein